MKVLVWGGKCGVGAEEKSTRVKSWSKEENEREVWRKRKEGGGRGER